MLALTDAMAAELEDAGVTVNAVLPSVIDTPANRKSSPNADYSKWPKPEEIARVILFLVGPEARLVSGAHVPVYGSGVTVAPVAREPRARAEGLLRKLRPEAVRARATGGRRGQGPRSSAWIPRFAFAPAARGSCLDYLGRLLAPRTIRASLA